MDPCHVKPFVLPGVVIQAGGPQEGDMPAAGHGEPCDYCGATTLEWRKCKLICASCRQINKSCADL